MAEDLYGQMNPSVIVSAPTPRAWAGGIGADGYAEDAVEAVAVAEGLVGAS